MRKTSIYGLKKGENNFFDALLPVGKFIYGGLHIYKPDEVSHEGEERHVHTGHYEVFIDVQGRGIIEVEGVDHEFGIGDIFLIEPGESHHVRADPRDPLVNLYIGAEIRED